MWIPLLTVFDFMHGASQNLFQFKNNFNELTCFRWLLKRSKASGRVFVTYWKPIPLQKLKIYSPRLIQNQTSGRGLKTPKTCCLLFLHVAGFIKTSPQCAYLSKRLSIPLVTLIRFFFLGRRLNKSVSFWRWERIPHLT